MNITRFYWTPTAIVEGVKDAGREALEGLEAAELEAESNAYARLDELVDQGSRTSTASPKRHSRPKGPAPPRLEPYGNTPRKSLLPLRAGRRSRTAAVPSAAAIAT
jgi:hypothetical protein